MEIEKPKCSSTDHENIDAIIFCHICKVYLCNKCENFHSKLFQNHEIQKITKEKNNFFSNICSEKNHLNKLKYFCKTHNKLCCVACISKIKDEENGQHKDCEICLLKEIKPEKEKKFYENFNKLKEISKSLDQTINELKTLYEKINKEKEELIIEIQKVFTKFRTALNEREDKLISEVGEIYSKNYFDEKIIKEGEKLPSNIQNCFESGIEVKNKWDNEGELSEAINFSIEFEKNLNKIDEINKEIIKCNSNKIKICFEINKEKLENKIEELGDIIVNAEEDEKVEKEKIEEESDKKSESDVSKKSYRSKSLSRKSSISSKKSRSSKSENEDLGLD